MKKIILILSILSVFLTGCKKEEETVFIDDDLRIWTTKVGYLQWRVTVNNLAVTGWSYQNTSPRIVLKRGDVYKVEFTSNQQSPTPYIKIYIHIGPTEGEGTLVTAIYAQETQQIYEYVYICP